MLVWYGWNDHWQAYGESDAHKRTSLRRERLYRRSRLLQGLRCLGLELGLTPPPRPLDTVRVPPEDFRANLEAIAAASRASGAAVVFVTPPTAHRVLGVPEYLVAEGFAPHAEVRFVGERPAVRGAEIDPADVRSAPLEHNGRTIGVSFETGQNLAKAQRWAQGDGKDITELLDTGRFNRATASGKRLRVDSPWSDNVFFVHGEGGRDHVELTLSDGRRVSADGARLAAALAASEIFRRAVGGGEVGHEIVLLAPHAGGRAVQGLGSDFQRALADSFGFDRPVLAPSKGLDLVHESGIRYSGTAVFDGGVWRTYPEVGTVLTGHTPDAQRIWFRGETLATTELTRGDSVVGVSYRAEADPVAREWAEQERAETSWPRRSFFVDAPGETPDEFVLR